MIENHITKSTGHTNMIVISQLLQLQQHHCVIWIMTSKMTQSSDYTNQTFDDLNDVITTLTSIVTQFKPQIHLLSTTYSNTHFIQANKIITTKCCSKTIT